ncbi:MAG: hypothetical protein ACUZ8H_12525 [Candidatus Anammoxibacter sp.]
MKKCKSDMVEILLILMVALLTAVVILQVIATLRSYNQKFPQPEKHLAAIESVRERAGTEIKDELKKNREDSGYSVGQGRGCGFV